MASSAYFMLEGQTLDGFGESIAAAGSFTAPFNQSFIVSTNSDNVISAILYTGVDSEALDFPADAASLARLSFSVSAGDGMGAVVLGGYDFNGDGIEDVAISAPLANDGNGAVYVIFGNQTQLPAALSASDLNGTNGVIINGFDRTGGFGSSLAAAQGDVGAVLYIGNSQAGADSGAVVSVNLAGVSSDIDLTEYDTVGTVEGGKFGTSITAGFDLNGDGIDDLAVGSPAAGSGAGTVTVTLSGGDTITLTGADPNNAAGTSVSAGDLNGDGIDDLIISAPNAGAVYVLFGKDNVPFDANYDLGNLSVADGLTLTGTIGNSAGGFFATNVGDVSGDGVNDLLIGGVSASGEGRAYLVFGGTGIGSLDLDTLDGTNGFVLNDIDLGAFEALTGAGIGDVNNDGINDLALGMPGFNDGDGQVLGILGGIENLKALDTDGDGRIDVGSLQEDTAPEIAFVPTNISVTIGGTNTGQIDLRVVPAPSVFTVEGTIFIEVENGTATFDTVAGDLPEGIGSYGTIIVEDDGDDFERWVYTISAAGLESLIPLGAGESVLDQIVLTADNGRQRAIDITLIGRDDPVIYTINTDSFIDGLPEGFIMTDDFARISGTFAAVDPDDTQDVDFSGQTIIGSLGSTFVISDDGDTFEYILNPNLERVEAGNQRVESFVPMGTNDPFTLTVQGRFDSDAPDVKSQYQLAGPSGAGVTVEFGRGNQDVTGTDNGDRIDTGIGDDDVQGGAGNDTIIDPFGNDTLSGGAGHDDITALSGTNFIDNDGGMPSDSNYFKGGIGRDTITGGDGNDFLDGDFASSMVGASDRLDGGPGTDYLRGGLGADTFVFKLGYGNDTIADFKAVRTGSDGPFELVDESLGRDFVVGLDRVALSGFAIENPITSYISNDSEGHAVLSFGTGDTLRFYGVTAAELTADSFVFDFA